MSLEAGVSASTRRSILDLRRLADGLRRSVDGKPNMQVGGTAPASPIAGDLWYDVTTLRIWDGAAWTAV